MRRDLISRCITAKFVAALLLAASGSVYAADMGNDGGATGTDANAARPAGARKTQVSRRGPALDDATGVVYVITPDDIRRSGQTNIRAVPGMDVVGRFEGSMQIR